MRFLGGFFCSVVGGCVVRIGGGALILRLSFVFIEFLMSCSSRTLRGVLMREYLYLDSAGFIIVVMSILVGMLSILCSQKDVNYERRSSGGRFFNQIEVVILLVVVICIGFFICSK